MSKEFHRKYCSSEVYTNLVIARERGDVLRISGCNKAEGDILIEMFIFAVKLERV